MSLISEFYRGDLNPIVCHILNRRATDPLPSGVSEALSLSTHGISSRDWLFASDLDDIANNLAFRSGTEPNGLRRYRAQLLEGDDGHHAESQILQMNDLFLDEFASLSPETIGEIAASLSGNANAEILRSHEFEVADLRKRIRWPFRSVRDYLAVVIALVFPITITKSLPSGLLLGVVFAIGIVGFVSFNLSRKLKRLEQRKPRLENRPIREMITLLSEFCKRARGANESVVYEWSL